MEDSIGRKESKSSSSIIGEGLLIAFLTAMGYILAYSYNSGYRDYYHIPSMFIDINSSKILLAVSGLYMLILAFYFLLSIMIELLNLSSPISKSVFRFVFIFCLMMVYAFINSHQKNAFLTSIIIVCIFGFLEFVFPLFVFKGRSYSEKMGKADKADNAVRFSRVLGEKIGHGYILIFFLAMLLIPICNNLGNSKAYKETTYLIIEKPTPMVVIDTYKDSLLVADVDLKNKKIFPRYRLIEQKAIFENNLVMKESKTGRLVVEENEH